jgi:hypothetical protein
MINFILVCVVVRSSGNNAPLLKERKTCRTSSVLQSCKEQENVDLLTSHSEL